MVSINYATREVSCKIVYYGPGLSGKTTNLQYVHMKVPSNTKGKLISLATDADRTLYFDFLPINIGTINGFASKFQLYTVPGQVYYNATRKLVLRGVDGLVFVADSQPDKMDENVESLNNLKENLAEYGYSIEEIPIVIQYNKQDLEEVLTPEDMRPTLNPRNWPEFKASATEGFGVFDTLKCILKLVLDKAKAAGEAGTDKTAAATGAPGTEAAPVATQPPAAPTAPTAAPPADTAPQQPAPATGPPVVNSTPAAPSQPPASTPGYDAAAASAVPQSQPATAAPDPVAVAAPAQSGAVQRESVPAANEPQADSQSGYRPFPGNTAEDEQEMISRPMPTAAGAETGIMNNTGAADAAPHTDIANDTQNSTSTGTPRMAPPLKADRPRKKKKRSFFKRLFGLK